MFSIKEVQLVVFRKQLIIGQLKYKLCGNNDDSEGKKVFL